MAKILKSKRLKLATKLKIVKCYIYSVFTYGCEACLRKVMMRVHECRLTLNLEQYQFSMSQLTFIGHVLSNRGVGVAAHKVKAVLEAREPESVSHISSFLCIIN